MKKTLSIEWMKLRKYRTFWVIMILFAVMVPTWNYGFNSVILKLNNNIGEALINKGYDFQHIWHNLSYWASFFVAFISVLVIILTTNEYSFRTKRQNIIDGQTRLQFYHAKWQLLLILSILTTLFVFIVGFLFGISTDNIKNFPGKIDTLLYLFILSINYYGFGLLLAILLKRSGIAIGIFFLYFMFIETLIQNLFNWFTKTTYGNLLPLQSSDELIPFPIMEMAKNMTKPLTSISTNTYVIASIIWIIVYYLIGRIRLQRSDW